MMGRKERALAPLAAVSLDGLVPADHFYRHLERALDLAFVRDLVRDRYAPGGRPSIDPIGYETGLRAPADARPAHAPPRFAHWFSVLTVWPASLPSLWPNLPGRGMDERAQPSENEPRTC